MPNSSTNNLPWAPHVLNIKDIEGYFKCHLDFPLKVTEEPEQCNTTPHGHEFVEMVVILRGTGQHVTLHDTVPLTRGDVLIIPVGVEHQYLDADGLSLVNILFDPEKLQFPRMDLCSLSGYDIIFRLAKHNTSESISCPRLHLEEAQMQVVEKQLAILVEEFRTRTLGFRTRGLGIFLYLTGILAPLFVNLEARRENYHQPAIERVLNYLEDHFNENISLATLLQIAAMSKSTLMREFRRLMGISPLQYLINIRLEHACQLIRENKQTISYIGYLVGFSSCSYFSRCFVKRFQRTPSQFRKQLM